MRRYDVEPIEGYDPQVGVLLAALADSTREWRGELGEPPVEAIVWQPRSNGPSIGSLLLHIIDVEAYWFETFAAKKRRPAGETKLLLAKETRVETGHWPAPPAEPIEWYLDILHRVRARTWDSLRGLPADRLYEGKDWSCTLRWVVAHVVQHDSYHGGQAVLMHENWIRRS